MQLQPTTLVPATPASALVFGGTLPAVRALDAGESGQRTVHLQRLDSHQQAGFAYNLRGPNCVMRWARVPAGHSGPVDVVVHFHGYKEHNRMQLDTKAAHSGLDLGSPGVAGPTLSLVPHGRAFASSMAGMDGFDFPAISTKALLDGFIDDALAAFGALAQGRPTRGRVILTGHSGGGAALDLLLQSIGAQPGVSGFQYFDATYGRRQQPNERMLRSLGTWIDAAIQRDLALVGSSTGEAAQQRLHAGGGHVRICFIDGSGTSPTARAADRLMAERLQALVPVADLRALLRRRYRAQRVANPRQVGHGLVPRTFGGRLLADPANDLSPDAQDLPAAPAQAHGFSEPWGENAAGEAAAWHSEAQDVAMPATASGDPLGLSPTAAVATLGYGTSWDERLRVAVEGFLASFMAIPVRIGSQTVRVHPPYFMNARSGSAPATQERHRLAREHRAAAPAPLRALINEARFVNARIGKSTPQMLRDLLQAAGERGLLQADPTVGQQPTPERLRAFLQHYGLGIDCSGFVAQALNTLIDLFPNAAASDRIAQPHSTPSSALKGGQGAFERVTDPVQLCAGDTMWLQGHIRILAWAERRGDRIVFGTAESRSSNPRDVGPAAAYWRLTPDPQAGAANFSGWRLERSSDLNAPDRDWARVSTTHVYGHYRPLRRLLQGAGATPTGLDARSSAPATGTTSRVSRTAITRDLTQAEVDRLAAIRFRNAADIEAFFRRSGRAGFIDWYNAGLAHSEPFRARGATATSQIARDRYTAFWNQVRTAFDRDEITALDFAAFTAISINETGGHLWANPERGGRGRSDAQGEHRGLAYFFDRIQLTPALRKACYNRLDGGRTAGWCFDNADFIAAHGALPGGAQLAHHGNDLNGVWHGDRYPHPPFSTDEDPAINGFIMQADFHKFRGRGVIQTTGRSSYARVVGWIKGYSGSNAVLLDYKRRWASYAADVACTRSRSEDWDRIFGESEVLAKGLSLHAGTRDDYRQMSTNASVLLHVPDNGNNNRGRTGSIYAMGRRISGAGSYGRGPYRQRVLALLHGMLAI